MLVVIFGPEAASAADIEDPSPDAGASRQPGGAALAPLPRWSEPELAAAEPADLARLDALIDALLAEDEASREAAMAQLRAPDATWLPALAERFDRLADTANKPALKILLDRISAASRERRWSAARAAPDLLSRIVAHPDRSSAFLRPLTELFAYSRMLEAIGTLPAARRVVDVYVRFGELARGDTELALGRLGDRAVAALIETTVHPVRRVAEWANERLDEMGKRVASEAVQVSDPVVRADILRAYGKIGDVDTSRLLISFAASDRALIRAAAREAVVMLGEAGLWQLRDAYEKASGARAPEDWTWERVAQELFAQFDRQRLSELYRVFNRGRDAARRGDLEAARRAFDQVLAYDPVFERGADMAPVYLQLGQQRADTDAEAAGLALRRAERLARSGPVHDRALSLRYTLDARALLERGIVDDVLVQRARELDPDNPRARALDAQLSGDSEGDRAAFQRYVAAAIILLLALLALLYMALRQRRGRRRAVAAPVDS